MAQVRLFLGVGLGVALQQQVQDWRQQHLLPLRWVRDSNLHMTVVFLGSMDISSLSRIHDVATRLVRQQEPFSVLWQTLDWFPSSDKAKVLAWLPEYHAGLQAWQVALRLALVEAGFALEEKPYRPHISLARVRRAEAGLVLPQPLQAVMPVDTLTLFRSDSTADGVHYRPLQHWLLEKHS